MRIGCVALVVLACGGGAATTHDDAQVPDATPATPSGCITEVSAGDHTFTCSGLRVDARVPEACATSGGATRRGPATAPAG